MSRSWLILIPHGHVGILDAAIFSPIKAVLTLRECGTAVASLLSDLNYILNVRGVAGKEGLALALVLLLSDLNYTLNVHGVTEKNH